ncbi:MAG TPA: hypothetical protein O0X19_02170 [Methanocorpusculum sp.]|nr:hypothetical protein [Methanocorpusculum sp.]
MVLSPEQVGRAADIVQKQKILSFMDADLVVLSGDTGIPLLTEDRAMQRFMRQEKLVYVTLPEVVERLVEMGRISRESGRECFAVLRDVLLQKRYDYETYLKKYDD